MNASSMSAMAALGQRRFVLLVEDDSDTRNLYRTRLKAEGFDVVAVGDGVEALRVLDQELPTAIVLDLGLPLLSGRDVAREVASRADTRHIPIVIVTGLDTGDLVGDVACILRKPIDLDTLVVTVRECVRLRRVDPALGA